MYETVLDLPINSGAYKIAVVTETWLPDINGVALTLANMVRGMKQKGYAIDVYYSSTKHNENTDLIADHEFLLPGFKLPFYKEVKVGLPAKHTLKKMWGENLPDVVLVVTEGPLGTSAIKVAHKFGIPVVSEFHTNFDQYCRYYHLGFLLGLTRRYLRRFHNKTDITLVPTRVLQDELHSQGYDNVGVLSRGVDTELFHPSRRDNALRKSWGINEDDLAVIFVGRLAAEKNLPLAVKAFQAIKTRDPKARFILVGDGPMRQTLEIENPDFIFCGVKKKEALARHYASADLFISPSMSETFGNTLIEAMASNLPSVSFNYAATQENITHGVNGIAVPFGDNEGFIQAVVEIITSKSYMKKLGMQAREKAEELSWNSIYDKFDVILSELIEEEIECDQLFRTT
ncbi:glycosyltransferase family 1 protein [Cocleimonas flava]|uniref:Glycosyltransferase involved in cell wall biosynthesis n=2 Tax=Cocleimonas flava TaxID=634765 RepID=A0A4V2P878_9GAMM|nr:glycosyltransferase involved in cell wall biosynthesis [Cocleimonas flava]